MSAMILAGLARTGLKLELTYNRLDSDPETDGPVNDTGLAPYRGDFQVSEEFACLLRMI